MKRLFVSVAFVLIVSPLFAQTADSFITLENFGGGVTVSVPLLDYSQVSSLGMGLQGRIELATPSIPDLRIIGCLSGLYYLSNLESISGLLSFGAHIGAGWQFTLSPRWGVSPSVGFGGLLHIALADSPSVFMDPAFTFGVAGSLRLSDNLEMYVEPAYQIFPEQGMTGHQVLVSAGIKILHGDDNR